MSARVLTVNDLHTSFWTESGRVTAVDGISFVVDRGEILGLVGESGCGKSVTAESLMRLLDEDSTEYSGTIELDGVNLLELSETEMRRRRGKDLAMVFQDPMSSLNPVYTIGDQIMEGILIHQRCSKGEARERALEMLRLTGLPEPEKRLRQYPHQLSGGQRQRVMIAMALASRPRLLIADEPTTALDVTTQAQILDLIEDLRDEFEMGTVFITHDLGVVAELCDRVAVMYLGQIIEECDVATLFDAARHPYTRGLLAATPDLDEPDDGGAAGGGAGGAKRELPTIPGRVPTLANVPEGCRFADRCAFVIEACRAEVPPLRELDSGHRVRCLRAEEIAAGVAPTHPGAGGDAPILTPSAETDTTEVP
ncbi:ABC transporter ATP-binding protein [Bogoriella caseilytica]|uniref:Peptide/nickel transport system ATP-binding protein n=1 Tax=Bogoriella caseilytica TaxID=56055 RepID=A0A3N2BDQ5_9MICO|nr:ABC transporter ATP-binding protein [Bogoriella caseilytica]ROR73376.1 peptide/nickel transport system ATP-binding protein [Bogoriella caseilytica]